MRSLSAIYNANYQIVFYFYFMYLTGFLQHTSAVYTDRYIAGFLHLVYDFCIVFSLSGITSVRLPLSSVMSLSVVDVLPCRMNEFSSVKRSLAVLADRQSNFGYIYVFSFASFTWILFLEWRIPIFSVYFSFILNDYEYFDLLIIFSNYLTYRIYWLLDNLMNRHSPNFPGFNY